MNIEELVRELGRRNRALDEANASFQAAQDAFIKAKHNHDGTVAHVVVTGYNLLDGFGTDALEQRVMELSASRRAMEDANTAFKRAQDMSVTAQGLYNHVLDEITACGSRLLDAL